MVVITEFAMTVSLYRRRQNKQSVKSRTVQDLKNN